MGDKSAASTGESSPSSPEQNPEDTGESLSILSPMEQRGDTGVLEEGSPSEDRGDTGVLVSSEEEERGDTLTSSWDSLEWADLEDWREEGLEEAAEEAPELILSAVSARVIFLLGLVCTDLTGFSLLARVARKARAASFLMNNIVKY